MKSITFDNNPGQPEGGTVALAEVEGAGHGTFERDGGSKGSNTYTTHTANSQGDRLDTLRAGAQIVPLKREA